MVLRRCGPCRPESGPRVPGVPVCRPALCLRPMTAAIEHDGTGRFSVQVGGRQAYLDYRRLDAGTVDFLTTWVPSELRGRDVGTQLVRHALAWARAEGLRVVPSCWFVATVAGRDPEDAALLVDR